MFGPTSSMPPAERFDGDTIDFRYEWTDYVGLDLDCPGLSDAISAAADQHKLIDATFSSWEWEATAAEAIGAAESGGASCREIECLAVSRSGDARSLINK